MNVFKQLRKEKGLTQIELASMVNVQQTTVSKWEVGRATPDYTTLLKLAKIYNVSVDYLLGRQPADVIERPPYDITDKQLLDLIKLYGVMNDIQKAQVLGYVVGLLEQAGINVKSVLGY